MHAVVVGSGIAGLLAARVLSDRCDAVTVVERDRFPLVGESRPGVPQGRHAHVLLASGAEIVEQLFPHITTELAPAARSSNVRYYGGGGYWCRTRAEHHVIAASRPALEGCLRQRVRALPNVTFLEGLVARGLLAADGNRQVVGVVLKPRAGGRERPLDADLVVDASGRGSRAPSWLAALGLPRPEEERVAIDLSYATRVYPRRPSDLGGDIVLVILPDGPSGRSATAMAVGGERWMVTLGGRLGDHPPTDDDGFLAFAGGLACGDLHKLILGLEPLGPTARMRFPAYRRVRYEQLRRPPEGFVAVGDAITSFNPVYAHGMSVAAKHAIVLAECLDDGLDGLPRRFYRAAARVVAGPWDFGMSSDLRFPALAGRRGARVRVVNGYLARAMRVAQHDSAVARALFDSGHLLRPPLALARPAVVGRVLRPHRPARPAPTPRG